MDIIQILGSSAELLNAYEPKTTFWMDFSIADKFGINAFNEWKDNHVYLTELVMVLNHKIWQWYETNDAIARLYDTLWREADLWAIENLKGEELEYYYNVTD